MLSNYIRIQENQSHLWEYVLALWTTPPGSLTSRKKLQANDSSLSLLSHHFTESSLPTSAIAQDIFWNKPICCSSFTNQTWPAFPSYWKWLLDTHDSLFIKSWLLGFLPSSKTFSSYSLSASRKKIDLTWLTSSSSKYR